METIQVPQIPVHKDVSEMGLGDEVVRDSHQGTAVGIPSHPSFAVEPQVIERQ